MRNGWLGVLAVSWLGIAACGDNLNPSDGACTGVTCETPPAPACAGDVLTTYAGVGACDDATGAAVCSYAPSTTDCTLNGDVCANGACVPPGDPCATTTCDAPPTDDCTGDVRNTYPTTGTCDGSTGTAVCTYTPATLDCTTVDQVCAAGACVDPCATFPCTTPLADECASGVFIEYAATGTCTSPGGVPQCDYATTQTNCAAADQACDPAAGCIDPCLTFACTPPANDCASGVYTSYAATCSSPGGVPQCDYSSATTDCAAVNLACDATAGCVDPCIGVTCTAPPAATCSAGGALTTYATPGACSSPGGAPQCDYVLTTTDCAALDLACDAGAGACVDPCTANPCTAPPADACTGDVLSTYPNPGACTSPGGVVQCDYPETTTDCTLSDLVCDAGSATCVDPCLAEACDTPPPNTCAGDTLTAYPSVGVCSAPGGAVQCDYAPATTDCAATGDICLGGACTTPVTVGFCRLQFPDVITDLPGIGYTVYGRVYVAGVTDLSGVNDPDPRIVAAAGYGAVGASPDTWVQWAPASPNASYGPGSPGYEANNDEYAVDVTVPPGQAGAVFDYGYRFSGDGGRTWTYCDTGAAGSSDGFNAPGVLTIVNPFFSEYIEGSSNNKALEIYNPGASAFPLAGCAVDISFNGGSSTGSIAIGTATVTEIAPGDVYVLCNTSYALADAAQCDQLTGSANWNGDDAITLRCGTTGYDVIGQVGLDPGTEWGTGLTSTQDNTLIRTCATIVGDTDGTNAFDPAVQWAGYAIDQSFLGGRSCPLP